jgi:hypothetical protein
VSEAWGARWAIALGAGAALAAGAWGLRAATRCADEPIVEDAPVDLPEPGLV